MRLALLVAAALPLAGCFDFDALRGAEDLSGVADGGASDAGDGSVGMFSFQSSWPAHKSLYYGSHDTKPATLSFTYDADSVLCSNDGGNNWAACPTPNSIIFSPQDYNDGHVLAVKVSKAGFDDAIFTFNPSVELPGLHFYDCDDTVAADEPAEAFYARLQPGRVVCLAPGVSILYMAFDAGLAPSTSGLFLTPANANNLKVIGVESDRAAFLNTRVGGNQGGFISMSSSLTGVVLSNLQVHVEDGNCLDFSSNGGNNAFSYLDLLVHGGGNDYAVIVGDAAQNNSFYNVDIDAQSSPGTPVVRITANASATFTGGKLTGRDDTVLLNQDGATSKVTLTNVTIEQIATAVASKQPAVNAGEGSITMSGGSVTSPDKGILIGAGGQPVMGSVTGTTVHAKTGVTVGYQSTASLAGLTLQTNGIGLAVDGATVHLDTTLFERLDQTGTAGPAIDVTNPCVISSSSNGNHFCDQNLAGANKYTAAFTIESGASNIGNFDLSKQVNMGMIDQCP